MKIDIRREGLINLSIKPISDVPAPQVDLTSGNPIAGSPFTATATTATLVSIAPYLYNGPTAHTTTLSAAGTYAFFVYDVTAQVIVSIVYVNAGQSFTIGVYQDPYHTQASYQYNINTSSAAYIYLPDVSTNDSYVVYFMSTSVNSFCVYVTPNSTPAPASPSGPSSATSPTNGRSCSAARAAWTSSSERR